MTYYKFWTTLINGPKKENEIDNAAFKSWFVDEWSMEDKVLFEQAYTYHGKNFRKIQQLVSCAILVMLFFVLRQRFSNCAPQGLARCATLAFRKFTTCFLHYSLFSGIYEIGYDDHLEVVRYPTLQLLQLYSWHKTLFLAFCST